MTDSKDKSSSNAPVAKRGGGPGMGPQVAMEKPKNFKQAIWRLVKMFLSHRLRATALIVTLIISAGLSAVGPKVLGEATNVLFNGLISKQVTQTIECSLPSNVTIDQVKGQLEDANGHLDVSKLEDMQSGETNPGAPASGSPAATQSASTPVNTSARIAPGAGSDAGSDASNATEGSTASAAGENGQLEKTTREVSTSAKPGCDNAHAEEFEGSANMDGIKEMLSQMTITLGGSVDFGLFAWVLLMAALVYLGTFLLRWIGGWISVRLIADASKRLRAQIEEKVWRLPLSYFDKTSRGEVMSRTTNDLDNVTQALNQTGGDLIYLILMIASVIVMMFQTSVILAIIALVTIPLSGIIIGLVMRISKKAFTEQWATTGKVNSITEESFTGHLIIKAFNKKSEFKKEFNEQNERLFKSSFKASFVTGCIMPIMTFMTNLNYVIVALVGALRILSGQMTLGDLQAFIQYSRQFSQPLGQIAQMMNMLQSGAASAERIFELLDATEESDESALPQSFDMSEGEIIFKGVDFSYDPDRELIKNMNLEADPGKTVAIVGETGAGKTTLVNLIMRFYDIDAGQITVDGTDTSEVSRQALRKNVGMVLQDTWLFKGTIRENLLYGLPEGKTISDDQLFEACKATHVDHFVRHLPDGYETVLNDEGSEVSTGEKQLLTIARAFLSDPKILILDEATSSVDTRTEVLVQKAMNALRANRTSFVIAHRLSTIRDADVIIVMEKGSIVEQGNHHELIALGGHYAKLYESQFEKAAIDEDGHGEELEVGA
ncbi:MAG: ABC transporter ATP-binding protein/permease [Candidatus Ancillula sp.]|jgi:ATP-binding cassette subfamily B protein|nr:ABC transporter ATP-binding protein/permease [Candidatus Ancillula sp.]